MVDLCSLTSIVVEDVIKIKYFHIWQKKKKKKHHQVVTVDNTRT